MSAQPSADKPAGTTLPQRLKGHPEAAANLEDEESDEYIDSDVSLGLRMSGITAGLMGECYYRMRMTTRV